MERHHSHLNNLQQHLDHLDPQQVLARGYSMVSDVDGKIVLASSGLTIGAYLDITFAQGRAYVEIKEKFTDKHANISTHV